MSLYIHIPFCKKRCIYCDFFSTVSQGDVMDDYIETLGKELLARKDYLGGKPLETVYFGGGTPSQLPVRHITRLFDYIYAAGFAIMPDAEITLEANPDDLSYEYLNSLKGLPFNRISIGVQSFNNDELAFLNRRHDAQSAAGAIELSRRHGFRNISIDLMYGLPGQSVGSWEETIRQALALDVTHISAYHLIYEEDTPLYNMLSRKEIALVNEDISVRMFETLIDMLAAAGYEHYEISAFARPGFRSRHNSAYWNNKPYLGVGASAHSYNGISRQWNVPQAGGQFIRYIPEIEILDEQSRFNDYILTRLRTKEGIDLAEMCSRFGKEKQAYCLKQARKHIGNNTLVINDNRLKLTRKGIFVSDGIMSDLIILKE